MIATVKFPYLDTYLGEDGTFNLDLKEFIQAFKNDPLYLIVGKDKYVAVRLHGFDYNQPMRIAFPDNAPPNIILVLQVYIDPDLLYTLYKYPLYILY